MSIREMYEYTYYKVYKSMTMATGWGADWRASGVFIVIQTFLPWSLIIYYELMFPYCHPIGFIWFIIPGIIISLIDKYIFHSKDQWKEIVKKYEAWPRKKNFIGAFIVWGIVSLVIANFFFALNLHDKVNWSQYQ